MGLRAKKICHPACGSLLRNIHNQNVRYAKCDQYAMLKAHFLGDFKYAIQYYPITCNGYETNIMSDNLSKQGEKCSYFRVRNDGATSSH